MPPQTCRILFQFLKILYFERRELWPGVLPPHTKWTEMQSCVKRSFTGDTRDTLRNVCVLCGYGNAHSNPVLGETVLGCWRTKKNDFKIKEQTDKIIFQRSISFFFFVAHFCSKARANQCAKEDIKPDTAHITGARSAWHPTKLKVSRQRTSETCEYLQVSFFCFLFFLPGFILVI